MLNYILDILALVLSLIAILNVYRLSKKPSKWWLENQQAEQLESIKDLLGEQELSKAINVKHEEVEYTTFGGWLDDNLEDYCSSIEHLDDEERRQLLVGRGNGKWGSLRDLLNVDLDIEQTGGDDNEL